MRRILNLNQPSVTFLKMIGLFAVVIPAVLDCALLLLKQPEIRILLRSLVNISFTIGAILFVLLTGLIIVEQIQDHYIDVQYQKNRGRKVPLDNGNYECQYCGNRKMQEKDKICEVCGKELEV